MLDNREEFNGNTSEDKQTTENEAQMRNLASKWIMLETRTRRSIANDLHNNVGQLLFLIGMAFHDLQQMTSSTESGKQIDKITNLLDQAFNETHNLIYRTYPPVLELLGLGAAIRELADGIEKDYGVMVNVTEENQPFLLSEDINDLLYQTVNKLLVIAVKNARANYSSVCLKRFERQIRIDIQVFGTDFDVIETSSNGAHEPDGGLSELKERLVFIGGSLDIYNQPDLGAKAVILVPINKN